MSLPAGKPVHRAQFEILQDGWVWQAEEVRMGDRWQRVYGFVGRHDVAAVPAEEVDFPDGQPSSSGYLPFSRDLDASVIPPGATDGRGFGQRPVHPGEPLTLTVRWRNHRGIEVAAPADLVRVENGVSLRAGTSIRLLREGRPVAARAAAGQGDLERWVEVEPWRRPGHHTAASGHPLTPTGTVEVLNLDLRELYDNLKPGKYRVELRLEELKDADGKPSVGQGTFTIEPRPSAPVRSTS
jgi:hypothetical protein